MYVLDEGAKYFYFLRKNHSGGLAIEVVCIKKNMGRIFHSSSLHAYHRNYRFHFKKQNKEYSFLLNDRVGKVNMADELISAQKDSFLALNGYVLFKTSDYVAARDEALEQSQA